MREVLGDFGVFVVDFLRRGDLAVEDFLVDFELFPEGVLGDLRGFFALERDLRRDPPSRDVGLALLTGDDPELEAVFERETTDSEGVTNDSRLAWE